MKTCGCPSDTLSSLPIMRPADRAFMNSGHGGEAGLAEQAPRVNRSLSSSQGGAR
jgi:hypothetical protein